MEKIYKLASYVNKIFIILLINSYFLILYINIKKKNFNI